MRTKDEQELVKACRNSDFDTINKFYMFHGVTKTRAQMNELPTLPNNIPIIIISSSQMERQKPMIDGWYKQQKHYLNKNPLSKAFMVDASHVIWNQKPEVICESIRELAQFNTD